MITRSVISRYSKLFEYPGLQVHTGGCVAEHEQTCRHIKLGQHLVREGTSHQEGMMVNGATQIERSA